MKIDLNTIKSLKNNDGLTLKNMESVQYKSGYQVATEGQETASPEIAMQLIESYEGTCGVWYSEGTYYIDKSHRVATQKEALEVGRAHNQISILKWEDMSLIYC